MNNIIAIFEYLKKIKIYIYNMYNLNKEFYKIIFYLFILTNLLFYFIFFFNISILIYIYNNIFIDKIDIIIYFLKKNLIHILEYLYNFIYNSKVFIIQKYYSIFEYNYFKNQLRLNYKAYLLLDNDINLYKQKIKIFFYKNILFPCFNPFHNTEFYKKFEPNKYGLDLIYSYKRKNACANLVTYLPLLEYIPDKKLLRSNHYAEKIINNYNYIYTSKYYKKKLNTLFPYNDLYIRRKFFIINNTGFLPSKEILHYKHDLNVGKLHEMSVFMENKIKNKTATVNFRRKNEHAPITSFEKFDTFDYEIIFKLENLLEQNINHYTPRQMIDLRAAIDEYKYDIFMSTVKRNSYNNNFLSRGFVERDYDNFYLTGTTEIYYLDENVYYLINLMLLSDYFFYFFYYGFVEFPVFLEDLYININKNTNFYLLLKNIIYELLKPYNIYIIIIFLYSIYLCFRSLLLNELDLLYALLFFKRHFTLLLIIGFMLKLSLDPKDPLTFELFLLLWLPGFLNYIVYEEWWWIWWSNFEKVKFHFTYNYEGVLYCPINLYILFTITPFYLQNFLFFKLFVLHYLIFHLNRVDFKWKYIIKKNLIYYLFLLYDFIFYNFFIIKEELKLLNTRFNMEKNFKYYNIFYINFNIYSRLLLKTINIKILTSFILLLKKYIQLFIYYIYMFIFIFLLLLMFFKIFYNLNFIINFHFINNNFDLINLIKKNFKFFIYFKNNLDLALFKEYKLIQNDNYSKYYIIYDFRNIQSFKNDLNYKFFYPGLIFYRTSRQYNGYMYWFFFQNGNNLIGETYYKATILNNIYKKNLPYFYKYYLFDRKNYNKWMPKYYEKKNKLSVYKKRNIQKRKLLRMLNYTLTFKTLLKDYNLYNKVFNFTDYNDLKFINLITKNFYKTTSFYTNNKTYFFSLYYYKYYNQNFAIGIRDLDIKIFIRKMHMVSRAWGKYHMASNFLFMYGHAVSSKNFIIEGKDCLNKMIEEDSIQIPFKTFLIDKKFNINNIILYNKYIPNRLDCIYFHSSFYKAVYDLMDVELEQTILEKNIIKPDEEEEKIQKKDDFSFFKLIFDYKGYLGDRNKKSLESIDIQSTLPRLDENVPIKSRQK